MVTAINSNSDIQASNAGLTPAEKLFLKNAKAADHDPKIDEIVKKYQDRLDAKYDDAMAQMQEEADQATGPVKDSLLAAKKQIRKQKKELDDMFKNVIVYSSVALWSMAKSEMNNVDATQQVQDGLMNLNEVVEQIAEQFSAGFTAQLQAIESQPAPTPNPNPDGNPYLNGTIAFWAWEAAAGNTNASAEINALTSKFNETNTIMQTFSTFYSGINNLINNGVAGDGQNITIDTSNIQQTVQKLFDMIAQLLTSS